MVILRPYLALLAVLHLVLALGFGPVAAQGAGAGLGRAVILCTSMGPEVVYLSAAGEQLDGPSPPGKAPHPCDDCWLTLSAMLRDTAGVPPFVRALGVLDVEPGQGAGLCAAPVAQFRARAPPLRAL